MSRQELLAIYGGTFSPPHLGHVRAARAFFEAVKPDKLLIIPSATPPHKVPVGGATDTDRLAMCRLAFSSLPRTEISDMELQRQGKSYTVDTLRELSGPENKLFLLCGTDMILSLDKWYCADEIFERCYPVYIRRENDRFLDGRIVAKIAEYNDKYGKVARRIVAEPIEISSSTVRKRIKEGKDISELVPPKVAEYIRKEGLYK